MWEVFGVGTQLNELIQWSPDMTKDLRGGGVRYLWKFVIGMKLVQSATRGLSVSYLPPKCSSTCRRVTTPLSLSASCEV